MKIKELLILLAQLACGDSPATMTQIAEEKAREQIKQLTGRDERIQQLRQGLTDPDDYTWLTREKDRRMPAREIQIQPRKDPSRGREAVREKNMQILAVFY